MYGYISVEGFLPSAELLEGKFGASNGKLAVTDSNFPIPDPKIGIADSNFELYLLYFLSLLSLGN
jgi:hypothetical protein